ncbi:FkbM family methyltransferase [Spirulina sp. CS-785/01]|uniref:FkbM family methyltransferase n=1 Tax=Spirulina sp. CS-785/01 TaxID=3021716 RepID=UPI00232ED16C|nr:FkbM family methyltransferase [Spirulina sp. CS-785/01]MDB9315423.1 FkbM family methyltransferase [Spirulina sp. CS-785/01]
MLLPCADRFIEPDTITLVDYFQQQDIQDCHFLKMDIEGAELEALKGSRELLAQHRIHYLLVEQPKGSDGQQLILDYGYTAWLVDEDTQQLRPLSHLKGDCFGNFLFVSPTHLDEFQDILSILRHTPVTEG